MDNSIRNLLLGSALTIIGMIAKEVISFLIESRKYAREIQEKNKNEDRLKMNEIYLNCVYYLSKFAPIQVYANDAVINCTTAEMKIELEKAKAMFANANIEAEKIRVNSIAERQKWLTLFITNLPNMDDTLKEKHYYLNIESGN